MENTICLYFGTGKMGFEWKIVCQHGITISPRLFLGLGFAKF